MFCTIRVIGSADKPTFYIGGGTASFPYLNGNMNAWLYQHVWDLNTNHQIVEFGAPKRLFTPYLGVEFPLGDGEKWTYEMSYSRSGQQQSISYVHTTDGQSTDYSKFSMGSLSFIGLRYYFKSKHSLGLSLPFSAGKVYYKHTSSNNSTNWETASTTVFITHTLFLNSTISYQFQLMRKMALRVGYTFDVLKGDSFFAKDLTTPLIRTDQLTFGLNLTL